MDAILAAGFLLGMRHALEADHLAAVATIVARNPSARRAVAHGAVWGLGHTLTLFVVCSLVLFAGGPVPEALAGALEAAVGAMLVALGADVARRALRDRRAFALARVPADGPPADRVRAARTPRADFPARALCVGMMHGLAGSAALVPLALAASASVSAGLLYVALFGLGSIGGMTVLSLAISLPLRGARGFAAPYAACQIAIGCATIAIGAHLLHEHLVRLAG